MEGVLTGARRLALRTWVVGRAPQRSSDTAGVCSDAIMSGSQLLLLLVEYSVSLRLEARVELWRVYWHLIAAS